MFPQSVIFRENFSHPQIPGEFTAALCNVFLSKQSLPTDQLHLCVSVFSWHTRDTIFCPLSTFDLQDQNLKVNFIHFLIYFAICKEGGVCLDIRRQFAGVGSILPSCWFRKWILVFRLCSKLLYSLNSLMSPHTQILYLRFSSKCPLQSPDTSGEQ